MHEGIRGATWIQLHADGRVVEQHYLPNAAAEVERTELERVSPTRFDELLALAAAIPDEYLVSASGYPDPHSLITLECIGERSRREWSISPSEIERDGVWSRLAQAFAGLLE